MTKEQWISLLVNYKPDAIAAILKDAVGMPYECGAVVSAAVKRWKKYAEKNNIKIMEN